MVVKFRDATPADSEFCYQIKKAAHRRSIEDTYGPWDETFQRQFHNGQWQPNGVVVVSIGVKEIAWFACSEHVDHIAVDGIYILPAHQRQGVGLQMLNKIKNHAKVTEKPVRLWVMKKNNSAMRFYLAQGFTVVGEKSTHWQMEAKA